MELQYLFAGFAAFWAGLLAYLIMLQSRLRALHADVARLEERLDEREPEVQATGTPAVAGRAAPEGHA